MQPAVLLNPEGGSTEWRVGGVMSVSADPLGAIISQWLVKTLEAMSQGRTSEEEEEQKQWGGWGPDGEYPR